jgi:hypothetical protein
MNDTSRTHGDGQRARCASFVAGNGRRCHEKGDGPAERANLFNPSDGGCLPRRDVDACLPWTLLQLEADWQTVHAFADATTAPKA